MKWEFMLQRKGLKIVTEFDAVQKAKHYNLDPSGIECIEVVRHRNFNIGSAFKYLWRQGLKEEANMDPLEKQLQDMDKAIYYIQDEKKRLQELAKPKHDPFSVCLVCNAERRFTPIDSDQLTCAEHSGREVCALCRERIFTTQKGLRIGYEAYHSICKEKQRGKK